MKYEIVVEYTEKDIKVATKRYLRKFIGMDFLIALVLGFLGLVYRLATGDRGWVVGFLGAALAFSSIIVFAVWKTVNRRSYSIFKMMKTPVGSFAFDDDGIAAKSDIGEGFSRWKTINELWCFPEVWLLIVSKGVYSTIPARYMSQDLKNFIVNKVRESGGKVYPKNIEPSIASLVR